jgi:hypothetical protein
MCAIAERGRFGVLAAAKPYFFRLVKQHFNAPVGHAINVSVCIVAKGLLLTKAAGTPGIHFARLHFYHFGAAFGYAGKVFVEDRFHFIQIE